MEAVTVSDHLEGSFISPYNSPEKLPIHSNGISENQQDNVSEKEVDSCDLSDNPGQALNHQNDGSEIVPTNSSKLASEELEVASIDRSTQEIVLEIGKGDAGFMLDETKEIDFTDLEFASNANITTGVDEILHTTNPAIEKKAAVDAASGDSIAAAPVLPTAGPNNTAESSLPFIGELHASSQTVISNHIIHTTLPQENDVGDKHAAAGRSVPSTSLKLSQEEEKVLQDMMASSSDGDINEMSNSEMLTVSQKMEAEFREMVMNEKLRKKQSIEGPTSYNQETSHSQLSKPSVVKKQAKSKQNTVEYKAKVTPPAKSRLLTPRAKTKISNSAPVTAKADSRKPLYQTPVKPKSNEASKSSKSAAPAWSSSTKIAPVRAQPSIHSTSKVTPTSSTTTSPALRSSGGTGRKTPDRQAPKTNRVPSHTSSLTSLEKNRSPSVASSTSSLGRMTTTKNVQGKVGSLDNMNHTPGGGKIKIRSERKDYSNVTSKCGSKDNISHTPRGGKVKIESKRLDYSNVTSKCGSKDNVKHTPTGGKVRIESHKLDFSSVSSKCGSKDNINYTPGGGKVKIESKKLDFSNVSSKCGSKDNIHHTPSGGKVKVDHKKLDFSHVKSKCGSKDNITHTPGGGKVKIEDKKVDVSKVQSKCGSTQNINHEPKGGKVRIPLRRKLDFANVPSKIKSLENVHHAPGGGKVKIFSKNPSFDQVSSKIGSKDNLNHAPGGGKVKILSKSVNVSNVTSKCGSLDNANHQPGGGSVRIFDEKPSFKEAAQSKVGSLDNADHTPGGGDVQIYDEKIYYHETVQAKIGSMNGTSSEDLPVIHQLDLQDKHSTSRTDSGIHSNSSDT